MKIHLSLGIGRRLVLGQNGPPAPQYQNLQMLMWAVCLWVPRLPIQPTSIVKTITVMHSVILEMLTECLPWVWHSSRFAGYKNGPTRAQPSELMLWVEGDNK